MIRELRRMNPDPSISEGLVAAAKDGNGAAMDDLMHEHLPSLRAYVRAHLPPALRQRESESDIVQTACRAAIIDLDQFSWRGNGSFRAWLSQIALNKIRGRQEYHLADKRDLRRESPISDSRMASLADLYRTIATPSQQAMAQELVDHMEGAVHNLPELYRETFLKLHVLGMTRAEVAADQGRSEEAVRVTGARAIARLAATIERHSRDT